MELSRRRLMPPAAHQTLDRDPPKASSPGSPAGYESTGAPRLQASFPNPSSLSSFRALAKNPLARYGLGMPGAYWPNLQEGK